MPYCTEFMHDADAEELGAMFIGEGWYVFNSTIPEPPNANRLCIAFARNRTVARKIVEALNAQNA